MTHTQSVQEFLSNVEGEALPYRQVFDLLQGSLPFTEAMIVTSLPRGGLQAVQPPRLPESVVRRYSREFEPHDRLTWQAIAREQAVRAGDVWSPVEQQGSPYVQQFMRQSDFQYAAAAPLASPVLEGYPGAVHLYRTASEGEFTDEELSRLWDFARSLDAAIVRIRDARAGVNAGTEPLPHRPPMRQFIFDASLRWPLPQADPSVLDDRLRDSILQQARRRFEHLDRRDTASDRVSLPDSRGDLWNFRVTTRRSYPALSDGPVIFFCLQPPCADWGVLRPVDFQADHEVARLLPALKFMQEQFHRGPTLPEIARTVHLSPFHFHRRFTELLGITPKHFLLDCQVEQAKTDLLARAKDLAKIATECGFAHQSHFTSRFKQATGLTPTRWRRMAVEVQRVSAN